MNRCQGLRHIDAGDGVGLEFDDLVGVAGVVTANDLDTITGLEVFKVIEDTVGRPAGNVPIDKHGTGLSWQAASGVPARIVDVVGRLYIVLLAKVELNYTGFDLELWNDDVLGVFRGNSITRDIFSGGFLLRWNVGAAEAGSLSLYRCLALAVKLDLVHQDSDVEDDKSDCSGNNESAFSMHILISL